MSVEMTNWSYPKQRTKEEDDDDDEEEKKIEHDWSDLTNCFLSLSLSFVVPPFFFYSVTCSISMQYKRIIILSA